MSDLQRQESEESRDREEPKSERARANNKAVKECRQRKEKEARKREEKTKVLKEKIPSLRENIRIRMEITEGLLNLLKECHTNEETIVNFMKYFEDIKKKQIK